MHHGMEFRDGVATTTVVQWAEQLATVPGYQVRDLSKSPPPPGAGTYDVAPVVNVTTDLASSPATPAAATDDVPPDATAAAERDSRLRKARA
jgi:hypothetical protein